MKTQLEQETIMIPKRYPHAFWLSVRINRNFRSTPQIPEHLCATTIGSASWINQLVIVVHD